MRSISYLPLFAILGFLASGLPSCDGGNPSPQETCKQAMAAICERASACGALADMGFSTVAECSKDMQAQNCSNAAGFACEPGQTFHADQASKCIDALKTQACTDLNSMPDACGLVCSAGGGTGGSGGIVGPGTGGAGGGGGSTSTGGLAAKDACNQLVAATCDRISACLGSAGLSSAGYTSVAACTTGMQADSCATMPASGCDSGQTYYPDQGKKCVDGMKSLACTDFSSGTFPAACDLICQ